MLRSASRLLISLSPPLPVISVRPLSRFSRAYLARISAAQHQRFSINSRTRLGFSIRASEQFHTQPDVRDVSWETNSASPTNARNSHPWPEWSKLVENLRCRGYFDRGTAVAVPDDDDGFLMAADLPEEFLRAANACLLFARDRPEVLSLLSRKDIEVLVENGLAFLFKNGMNSAGRLRSFLCTNGNNVLEANRAYTVDVMQILLSYVCNPLLASDRTNLNNRELVETSVRNLLNELAHISGMARESVLSEPTSRPIQDNYVQSPTPRQFQDNYVQSPRPFGRNIEMKRGDWICPKCSFMNFARNVKCLECNEARPKRQLTGGEWECPQCDFFNYGRNTLCLRCDCKRPGETLLSAAGTQSGLAYSGTLNGTNSNKSDIESKLAANDEKAERWFRKVSQMDVPDISSAVADEDFPEIMPLRKGVNRFVVSTRKTPLERRLEKAQYTQNLSNSSLPGEGNDFQGGNSGQTTHDRASETSINQCLDRILGRPSAVPDQTYNQSATGSEQGFTSSQYRQNIGDQRSDPGYVPFVPSPADMFAKPQNTGREASSVSSVPISTKDGDFSLGSHSRGSITNTSHVGLPIPKPENTSNRESEQADRWFKKDQPPTLPQSKRRLAMDQSNSSNFVPFVPFPRDYFAKKNKLPESGAPTERASETSGPEKLPDLPKSDGFSHGISKNLSPDSYSQSSNKDQQRAHSSVDSSKVGSAYCATMGNSAQQPSNIGTNAGEGLGSRFSGKENSSGSATQQFERKGLEGSLVKEPDPLDMSEEAKAERWFRRVAQIKDISELSQIPDEDFPSIMPMRKGVNRFVVSKRKTPLERRLTSQQYRRSLPIVSSDPTKKDTSS